MQPDQRRQLLEALSQSATDMTEDGRAGAGELSFTERIEAVTRAAMANVPGAAYVGLTLYSRDGGLESVAPTSPDVAELDRLQVDLDEGPCRDAIKTDTALLIDVPDFSTETRWPRFAPAAVARGALSLMSFAMAPQDLTPGALNFYSRARDGFDSMAKVIAGAFAMQAGVALYGAQRIADLETALQTRDVIGQAKGILMERHQISDVEAFERLVRGSKTTNIKLVDVARWVAGEICREAVKPQPDPR